MDSHAAIETDLLEWLFKKRQLGQFTSFMISGAYPDPKFDDRLVRPHVFLGVKREELGLFPNLKPGDVDILVLPEYEGNVEFSKAMAIEVKVPKPSVNRPDKNPSTLGRSQVKGLLRDGFPYCGLLHLVAAQNLPEEFHKEIPIMSYNLDENGELIPTGETLRTDHFGFECSKRQLNRLRSFGLDNYIGFSSQSINIWQNTGQHMMSISYNTTHPPSINPKTSKKLINNIEKYFTKKQISTKELNTSKQSIDNLNRGNLS